MRMASTSVCTVFPSVSTEMPPITTSSTPVRSRMQEADRVLRTSTVAPLLSNPQVVMDRSEQCDGTRSSAQ